MGRSGEKWREEERGEGTSGTDSAESQGDDCPLCVTYARKSVN